MADFAVTCTPESRNAHWSSYRTRNGKKFKSSCIDLTGGRLTKDCQPGSVTRIADTGSLLASYKSMGANVIQTFCVSCNGYAWYKNGVVTEQPGLKFDFLPEVVKLGHKEGMLVMGYFCIAANTRWGQQYQPNYRDPERLSYPFHR